MINELTDKIYITLRDYIRFDFDQCALESRGLAYTDILGSPDDDPDNLDISDEIVCRAFPRAIFGKDTMMDYDDDAYAEIEQAVLESCEYASRLEAWEEWYYDTDMAASDLSDLIAELSGLDSDHACEAIIGYALDNGLTDLLPTDNSSDSYLKFEHLYWAWYQATLIHTFAG